ncbi:DUF2071 domain-containing protein [Naasia lichenicola]|uniref:DUF2071 domain-containing protein n=1 Tax=Naasia lichenicola TaxID=2565933 RepID=A0A4S4FSD0_9MICO|nr:DUF2071 domain-containing protein [Naasia lichenicola]
MSRIAPALAGRAVIAQRWTEATFLHWRVDAERVAPHLPPGTRPDVFDGSSWVGLIPFRLSHSSFFGGPPVPYFGTFPEINVRLYSVDELGRRAVVFASLEASHLAPVLVARAAFGLPYQWARMSMGARGDLRAYRSHRISRPRRLAPGGALLDGPRSHVISRVLGEPVQDDPLADFLTARWSFHQSHRGRTWFGANQHEPWPLQRAELVHLDDQLLAAAGFPDLAERAPDSALFSPGVRTTFSAPGALPRALPR